MSAPMDEGYGLCHSEASRELAVMETNDSKHRTKKSPLGD
jgi:hypothetical protein